MPAQAPEPSRITHYATLSRQVHEYFAEGMADFLHSPEKRAQLRQRDPDMYAYCEARGWH